METKKILTILVVALGVMVLLPAVSKAEPMGTAFTYQGRLIDANGVADGLYDFMFDLYDAVTDGNQLDGTVEINDLAVYDGYFTVLLDFGSIVFNGDARWLEICVRPGDSNERCTTLSPRQEITATPYALQTRGIFVNDALDVGIGTSNPLSRLSAGGDGFVNTGVYGNGSDYGVYGNSSTYGVFGRGGYSGVHGRDDDSGSFGRLGHGTYGVYGSGTVYGGYFLGAGYFSGKVGIGTTEPTRDLHIHRDAGPAQVGIVTADASSKAQVIFGDVGGNTWTISSDNTDDNKLHFRSGHASGIRRVTFQQNGNVGIGTTGPGTRLHIAGGSDASLSSNGFLMTGSESGKNIVIDDNEIIARNNGSPAKLYLNNESDNVVVSVLEITGGSDLAEPFEVAGAESIEAGMVLAIDPEHPGQLRIADKPYDRTVAGIVSGANGINPGMTMSQRGTVTEGSFLVTLTGRVYVRADASKERIEPGDLLTTSQTPGHAMKVTDYSKAQGAILGKAMSSLDEGQGFVLVLVTLQ